MIKLFIYKPLLYCYVLMAGMLTANSAGSAWHPLHVSKADISFNAQSKHLEVICTIFTDDFETILAKQNTAKVDLSDPAKHANMEALVSKYAMSHLVINANAKNVPLKFLGFEREKESINIYLESSELASIKRLDAEVSLLYDLYEDQSNIVHITVGGKRNSTKLDRPTKLVSAVY